MTEKIDIRINLVILGNSSVGKTSFILRYVQQEYKNTYIPTVGIDFLIKEFILPTGQKLKIYLYDTAGQEKFRAIAVNSIKLAEGIVLMYDISKLETYELIENWIKTIKDTTGEDFPVLLIGNKCDLINERIVEKKEGEEMAKKNGFLFFETSNKNGINIDESISALISKILQKREKNENKKDSNLENCFQLNKKKETKARVECNC